MTGSTSGTNKTIIKVGVALVAQLCFRGTRRKLAKKFVQLVNTGWKLATARTQQLKKVK